MKSHSEAELRELVARGEIWRLKSSLQGRIRNEPFSVQLYDEYGRVLRAMGDGFEAGKYLFLSGSPNPEHAPFIEEFLRRFGRDGATLVSTFPSRARHMKPSQFPAPVQEVLRRLNAGERLRPSPEPVAVAPRTFKQQLWGALATVGCGLLACFVMMCFFTGLGVMMGWIGRR